MHTPLPYRALALSLVMTVVLSACGDAPVAAPEVPVAAKTVRVQTVDASGTLSNDITYPATVVADRETKITAKTAGTVRGLVVSVGDQVGRGQTLFTIDDTAIGGQNRVTQSQLAVTQAGNSLNQSKNAQNTAEDALATAKKSYDDLVTTTDKDLQAAAIARDQAISGLSNTSQNTSETKNTAELAYENAELSVEKAKLDLENGKAVAVQKESDNAASLEATVRSLSGSYDVLLDSLNDLFAFRDDGSAVVSYRNQLGNLDSGSYSKTENAYFAAEQAYIDYTAGKFGSAREGAEALKVAIDKMKTTVDAASAMLGSTVSSSELPPATLASLRSTISSAQTAAGGFISTITQSMVTWDSTKVGNQTQIASLEKAVMIAEKAVEIAKQNVSSATVSGGSQVDTAGFGVQSANNAYEKAKTGIEAQRNASRSQVTAAENALSSAKLAVRNAENALGTARLQLSIVQDDHTVASAIEGVVTDKQISEGSQVAAGAPALTIASASDSKVQFYVDGDRKGLLREGMEVTLEGSGTDKVAATISVIAPQADSVSHRFLVEAVPGRGQTLPAAGTILTARIRVKVPAQEVGIYLPLAALSVTQGATTVYRIQEGKAVKTPVKILFLEGETASVQLEASLPPDTQIVIEGSKLLVEGDTVTITK